ncbi:MAG: hypothetical protein HYU30_04625 [Chloroflexi bacterium]|nr:hypothetical protein [Chloroflexota bacterium]
MTTNGPLHLVPLPSTAAAPETPHRGPGAPIGNQNARKHGYYAKALLPEEEALLHEAIELRDLRPEIAFMRVKLLSLISNPTTPDELLIKAVGTLTRLMAVQDRLTR